jgi:HTH-type transcriptional regulator / antitoxin HigA
MIPTFSQQAYTDLLIQYQPKPIKTEHEYKRALTVVEAMMSGEFTEAETAIFELLVLLIENYEERHFPMGESKPVATLESLMHEFDVEPNSLAGVFGTVEIVREVVNGQRKINQSQAESLAKFFNDHYSGLSITAFDFIKQNSGVRSQNGLIAPLPLTELNSERKSG